ncbi:MAG: ribose 5-phosphate isomerase B [Planctomycetes bacterium]|nr:ribose 5-phosphate isomerase B [Planctomycetota bacterium]
MPDDKTIAIGSDHAALEAKAKVIKHLEDRGYTVTDFTQLVDGRADYPDAGHAVARAVAGGEFPKGILLCGTGIGISIAANRHKGARAALCLNSEYAALSRDHNDANILVMPGRATILEPHETVVDTWLDTPFSEGERHRKRIAMIDEC